MTRTTRTGRARAVRRARDLVAYWDDDRLIVENFTARTRVACPTPVIRVLEVCAEPLRLQAIAARLPEYRPQDVQRLVREMLQRHLLEWVRAKPTNAWQAWNPAAGFFHFSTKDVPFPENPSQADDVWRLAGPRSPMPPPVKKYRSSQRVKLPRAPAPDAFSRVLLARRTWREFSRGAVDLHRLSTLLHLTWGIQRWGIVRGQGRVALKTSPSGGARHSGEVYVWARRVTGLAPGLYHYAPDTRSLSVLKLPRPIPRMADILPGQPWYRDAPVLFIMTAVFARAQWRYAFPRAYRAVLIEAGHLCQTCCLGATALGLAPFCSMAFPDSRVEALLGIDGVTESALYIAGVGVPPVGGWRPWSPHMTESAATGVSSGAR